MSYGINRRQLAVVLAASIGLALAGLLVAQAADWPTQSKAATGNNTFSGRAVALQGTVAGVSIPCAPAGAAGCKGIADTGEIGLEGGELEANLLCYPKGTNCAIESPVGDPTNGAVAAEILHATVTSQGNKSQAETYVAQFGVTVAGTTISGQAVTAEAEAKCADGKIILTAGTELLRVNGQQVLVVGDVEVVIPADAVNYDVVAALPEPLRTTLQAAGVGIVVNEQSNPASNKIRTNAIHITGPLGTDVIIGQAEADINCAPAPGRCPGARVTGGGWYNWPATTGDRVHFVLAAKDGLNDWGHLLYQDKVARLTVKAKPDAAVIYGTGKNDG